MFPLPLCPLLVVLDTRASAGTAAVPVAVPIVLAKVLTLNEAVGATAVAIALVLVCSAGLWVLCADDIAEAIPFGPALTVTTEGGLVELIAAWAKLN